MATLDDINKYLSMDDDEQANTLAGMYARVENSLGASFASQLRQLLPPLDERFTAPQLRQSLPPLHEHITEVRDNNEDAAAAVKADVLNFVKVRRALEKAARQSTNKAGEVTDSPIQAMKSHIGAVLSDTLPMALYLATAITTAIEDNTYAIQLRPKVFATNAKLWEQKKLKPENLWKTCKFVANFILNVASSEANAQQPCNFARASKVGDILNMVRSQPTTSFRLAFNTAKVAAQKQNKTTVIGVQLADVYFLQLSSKNAVAGHCSFAHTFAVAIGPEGFVIWQAWGEHGYRLDEWIDCDGDRVRSWDEAELFVKDFEKLTEGKGPWNAKRNKLYKKLFEIDLHWMCGPKGPKPRCLVPKFEAWVHLEVLEDVKVEDILKFKFE